MLTQQQKDFLTIRKQFYNFSLGSMSEKVFRFYNARFSPPTLGYTMNPTDCEVLQPIEKTLNFSLTELDEKTKEAFAENIIIQEKVLESIRNRNEKFNYRCGLIRLTTGKGKSHIILDVTNYYQTNTLILVHNVKTLSEMREKFVKFSNIRPAIYGGGKKETGAITIMTKKSFTLDYDKIKENFGLVLIDEAPIGFSKKLWNALNIFFHDKKGIALYGLSGTPYKNDLEQTDLEKYFGLTIEIKGQKNNGYNIIPRFTFLDYYGKRRYEYETPAEMRTSIADDTIRLDSQIHEILLSKRKCTLVLTDRVQEAQNFLEKLSSLDCFVFLMTGETKTKDDDQNIKLAEQYLQQGKQVIIVGTIQKIGVGVDIAFIDTIFLASAIRFKASVVQAIGRGLRLHPSKTDVEVYVWNDLPILRGQRREKEKSIKEEYKINNIFMKKLG